MKLRLSNVLLIVVYCFAGSVLNACQTQQDLSSTTNDIHEPDIFPGHPNSVTFWLEHSLTDTDGSNVVVSAVFASGVAMGPASRIIVTDAANLAAFDNFEANYAKDGAGKEGHRLQLCAGFQKSALFRFCWTYGVEVKSTTFARDTNKAAFPNIGVVYWTDPGFRFQYINYPTQKPMAVDNLIPLSASLPASEPKKGVSYSAYSSIANMETVLPYYWHLQEPSLANAPDLDTYRKFLREHFKLDKNVDPLVVTAGKNITIPSDAYVGPSTIEFYEMPQYGTATTSAGVAAGVVADVNKKSKGVVVPYYPTTEPGDNGGPIFASSNSNQLIGVMNNPAKFPMSAFAKAPIMADGTNYPKDLPEYFVNILLGNGDKTDTVVGNYEQYLPGFYDFINSKKADFADGTISPSDAAHTVAVANIFTRLDTATALGTWLTCFIAKTDSVPAANGVVCKN